MVFALTWLPEVLEKAGVKVAEVPDWRTRGRGEMGRVRGVMLHHTAGAKTGNMPSLALLKQGRSDLPGPLAHLGLGRDGTFYVLAAGRCNHAGAGAWQGVTTGNSSFIGIEAENCGVADDPWPEVQMEALRRGVAALLARIGTDATMCCGHKEFALPRGRKTDPLFAMAPFREAVTAVIAGRAPLPRLIPASDAAARPTLRRGARGPAVASLQAGIGIAADGSFGPGTEARVRQFQRDHALVPDGIVGPRCWAAIDAGGARTPAPADATPSVGAADIRPVLRLGAHGPAVRRLQAALGLPADGGFGPATEAGVRAFQRDHGLDPDGVVGPRCWAAIEAAGVPAPSRTVPAAPVSIVSADLPPVDSDARPVTLSGLYAVSPAGSRFATRHKLGYVTNGDTSLGALLAGDPDAARGASAAAARVVAAVTANEGKLEAINSWDTAFLSVGIMQWSMGQAVEEGELPAMLARLAASDAEAYRDCFGRYGVEPAVGAGATTGLLSIAGERLAAPAAKEALRTPTWAYRFWRAAHHPAMRRAQLAHAANRIGRFADRAIHGHPLRAWLSSELGIAMILDQHVNRPAHVPRTVDAALGALLAAKSVPADPAAWKDDDEHRLLERYLADRGATSMTDQQNRAKRLYEAARRGRLSAERGSFR